MLEQLGYVAALLGACFVAVRLTTGASRRESCGSGGGCGCDQKAPSVQGPVAITRPERVRVGRERCE